MVRPRKPDDGPVAPVPPQTRFGDDRLAVENSVKGEAILVLVAIAFKKGYLVWPFF
jgi:hypothetical protein